MKTDSRRKARKASGLFLFFLSLILIALSIASAATGGKAMLSFFDEGVGFIVEHNDFQTNNSRQACRDMVAFHGGESESQGRFMSVYWKANEVAEENWSNLVKNVQTVLAFCYDKKVHHACLGEQCENQKVIHLLLRNAEDGSTQE